MMTEVELDHHLNTQYRNAVMTVKGNVICHMVIYCEMRINNINKLTYINKKNSV